MSSSVRHIFKPISYLEIQLLSGVSEGYINNSGNSRNGKTAKNVRSQNGELELQIPLDPNSTFEPALIAKNEKQFDGFDDRVISLYSRGLTTRDIQAHFKEVYGVDVSAVFISHVTMQ